MKLFIQFVFLNLFALSIVYSKDETLGNKVQQQLIDLSMKKPVIRLNTDRFNQFVKTNARNYSIVVMFTALSPQRQCGGCKPAHDEFEVVARSYRNANPTSDKVFFGMVDYDEGAEIFQALKVTSAPVFIHFPVKAKPKKSDYMDVTRRGFAAEIIAKWIQERTETPIPVHRPVDYSRILLAAFVVILSAGFLYTKRNSLGFLFNKIFWGTFVILMISFCISGQIWNSIRTPNFVHRNQQTGEIEIFADDSNMQFVAETYIGFFSGSSGYQFVAETYIVFLLYFGLSAGVILLNEAPTLRVKSSRKKTIVAVVGMATVVIIFSYIVSVFRAKYQGYPYSFLIK